MPTLSKEERKKLAQERIRQLMKQPRYSFDDIVKCRKTYLICTKEGDEMGREFARVAVDICLGLAGEAWHILQRKARRCRVCLTENENGSDD